MRARSAPRARPLRSPCRAPLRPPPTPAATAGRSAPRPTRCGFPGRSGDGSPPRSAPHIWRQGRLLEREDIGRDQPVGGGQPAPAIGLAIVRDDQVEIEHQPVELLFAQARAVEQDRARRLAMLGGDGRRQRRDARIDRRATAPRRRGSRACPSWAGSGGEADERQRRRGLQEDRPADLGAEHLAVEDDVGADRLRC